MDDIEPVKQYDEYEFRQFFGDVEPYRASIGRVESFEERDDGLHVELSILDEDVRRQIEGRWPTPEQPFIGPKTLEMAYADGDITLREFIRCEVEIMWFDEIKRTITLGDGNGGHVKPGFFEGFDIDFNKHAFRRELWPHEREGGIG